MSLDNSVMVEQSSVKAQELCKKFFKALFLRLDPKQTTVVPDGKSCPFPTGNGSLCGTGHSESVKFKELSFNLLRIMKDVEHHDEKLLNDYMTWNWAYLGEIMSGLVCSNHRKNELKVPLETIDSWLYAKRRLFSLSEIEEQYPDVILVEKHEQSIQDSDSSLLSPLKVDRTEGNTDKRQHVTPIHTSAESDGDYFSIPLPVCSTDSHGQPTSPATPSYKSCHSRPESPVTPSSASVFDESSPREIHETPDSAPPSLDRPNTRASTRQWLRNQQETDGSPSRRKADERNAKLQSNGDELESNLYDDEESAGAGTVRMITPLSPPPMKSIASQSVEPYESPTTTLETLTEQDLGELDRKMGIIYIGHDPHDTQLARHYKIGFTSNDITKRYSSKSDCRRPCTMEFLAKSNNSFHCARRVEQLVLHDLWWARKRIKACKSCGKNHEEWLEADLGLLVETVNRWIRFVSNKTYDRNGSFTTEGKGKLQRMRSFYEVTDKLGEMPSAKMLYFSRPICYNIVRKVEIAWTMMHLVELELIKVKKLETEFLQAMEIAQTWDAEGLGLPRQKEIRITLEGDWPKLLTLKAELEMMLKLGEVYDASTQKQLQVIQAHTVLDVTEFLGCLHLNYSLGGARRMHSLLRKTLSSCSLKDTLRLLISPSRKGTKDKKELGSIGLTNLVVG